RESCIPCVVEVVGTDRIRTSRRSYQNPCARIVDGVLAHGIAGHGSAGAVDWDAGLVAAADRVSDNRVAVAAEFDTVENAGRADSISLDGSVVGGARGRVGDE